MNKISSSFIHRERVPLIIFIIAFVIRLVNIDWPFFSPEEARIIERGFLLAKSGKDELGRFLPLLFNSFSDYQLPLLSYLTALLEFGGKSFLVIRLGFISFGSLAAVLTYLIAKRFLDDERLRIFSALVVSFSPLLIFTSKIPNTGIILVNVVLTLIYLILNKPFNKKLILLTFLFGICLSKNAWLILPILVPLTFILFTPNLVKSIISFFAFLVLVAITVVFLYIKVPQSIRSLSENQFTVFSDITIKNGINTLRGQGLEKHVPIGIPRLLFNKLDVIPIGFLQASSYFRPNFYFGIFNIDPNIQIFLAGVLSKVIIVPFLAGLFFLATKANSDQRKLLALPLVFVIPGFFKFPEYSTELIMLIVPIFSIIASFGFKKLNLSSIKLIVGFMILEFIINSFYPYTGFVKKDLRRPVNLASFFKSISDLATDKILISDNFYEDMIPYLGLYSKESTFFTDQKIDFPYKFHESKIGRIGLIGADTNLKNCLNEPYPVVLLTKDDLRKIPKEIEFLKEAQVEDQFLEKYLYRISAQFCLKDE